jgi:hypothetical protein
MPEAGDADRSNVSDVIYRVLRTASILCSAFVVLSFGLFARDQAAGASNQQAAAVLAGNQQYEPKATTVVLKHGKHHAQPRRFIDGVASKLESPFDSIVSSNSAWVDRGLPAIFALIAWGAGLGFLARFTRGFAHTPGAIQHTF